MVIRENGTGPAVAVCSAGPVYHFSELVSCKILISAEVFNPPPPYRYLKYQYLQKQNGFVLMSLLMAFVNHVTLF